MTASNNEFINYLIYFYIFTYEFITFYKLAKNITNLTIPEGFNTYEQNLLVG